MFDNLKDPAFIIGVAIVAAATMAIVNRNSKAKQIVNGN